MVSLPITHCYEPETYMKKALLLLLSLACLLPACSPDETTVGIARHQLIFFTAANMTWRANSYAFGAPLQVVAYPADSTLPGRLYSRLTLNAYGKNDKGANLQLTISFDAEDASQLIGTYRTLYTTSRGLAQAQIFNLDNNDLAVYALRAGDTTALFQVKRQSSQERLLAGNFQMTLYNTRDTTQTINITDGTFTDVTY